MRSPEIHTIGRYVNLTLLGQGGMGAVYRGRDPELERPVAVKVMLDATPDFVARFRREAQAIARLAHPNIVQVYDFGVDTDGNPYFVMELIDGTPLDKIIRDRGRIKPADAIRLVKQAAEGLAAAHRAGIVHRDIKPSNLIVDGRGLLKLVDFGIARVREGGGAQPLTNAAALMGTPGYMAPEQAMGGKPVDHRADIFALGLTLYHMLAGEPPFSADDAISLVVKNIQEPLPDLRPRGLDVPEELVRLVEQMSAKKPEDRLQSCEAVVAALDALAESFGASTGTDIGRVDTDRIPPTNVHAKRAEAEAAVAASPSTGGARRRAPTAVIAAAGVAVAAVVGVLAWSRMHGPGPTPPHDPKGPITSNVGNPEYDPKTHSKPLGDVKPADNSVNVNNVKDPTAAVVARPGSDDGAGPLRVSVLKFKNVGNDKELSALELGIGETAITEMGAGAAGVKFIERANLDEDIAEIDRAGDVHFNPQEVAKLGRLQGAQVAVLGGFQKAGKELRITARFVRVENGQILDSLTVTQPAKNPLKAQDEVARGLTKKLVALAAKWGKP